MSLLGATILTAYATLALAILALTTAVLAGLAFLKQSREVRAIERQVTDAQEVTRQQAELIKLQSDQVAVSRAGRASRGAPGSAGVPADGSREASRSP